MTPEEMRKLREDTVAGRADGLLRRQPLTREFLERVSRRREQILARRGGAPFPEGWVRDAIDEGRM